MEPHIELLQRSSFAKADIRLHFDFALTSISAGLMQLTAEPVTGLTPKQLMNLLTNPTVSGAPNLLVQLSLSLGPSVLGTYGASYYVDSAIMYENEKLIFTPKFRLHLRNTKQVWLELRDDQLSYEHGKGCPVGRCFGDKKTIPLQSLLDAIMYVYNTLP